MDPSTSSSDAGGAQGHEDNNNTNEREIQQAENLQKQLKMMQAEERALNSILVELRHQSRKLKLEKYRLLELCKKKKQEEQEEQKSGEHQTEQFPTSFNPELFMFWALVI